jgi:uncharacterized tellurite resistance protein B-like protein
MNENLKQHFLGIYQMIISDAEVHPKELELLYKIGKEKGVSEQEIHTTLVTPNSLLSLESLSDDEKIEYLYDLARMAWADGRLDDNERVSITQSCKRLGFQEQHVADIVDFLLEQAKSNISFTDVLKTINEL